MEELQAPTMPLIGEKAPEFEAPTTHGTLRLRARDGQLIFKNINSGDYTFSISKEGYVSGTGSGKVTSGETTSITITLEKASGGIPGFPVKSLVLGMLVSIMMFMMSKKN